MAGEEFTGLLPSGLDQTKGQSGFETGESFADGFLGFSFRRRMKHDGKSPFDLTCYNILQARGSKSTQVGLDAIYFHFQCKGGESFWRDGVRIEPSTFEAWLKHVPREPVFLLYVRPTGGAAEFWFLVLHDWLLTERGQSYLSQASPRPRFSVKRDFTCCDRDGDNLHAALLAEGARAARADSSLWATLDDWTVFPFDEAFLLRHMEIATHLELPARVLSEVRAFAPLGWRERFSLMVTRDAPPVPSVFGWFSSVNKAVPIVPPKNSFQRRQFLRFVKAVTAFEQGFDLPPLPPFRSREMSCWRAFVATYPGTVRMLQQYICKSRRYKDLIFAAALLPVLAISENGGISDTAHKALGSVRDKVTFTTSSTSREYTYHREILRSLAESGDRQYGRKLIDHLNKHGIPEFERRFLSSYGWTSDLLIGNIEKKLKFPARRDENLRYLYEAMDDLLV